MKLQFFIPLLVAWMVAAIAVWLRQHTEIEALTCASKERPASRAVAADPRGNGRTASPGASPSRELLKLRGEVALLRGERQKKSVAMHLEKRARDWKELYQGAKPSELEGYVSFSKAANVGFSTPTLALESFYFVMGNQEREPLTRTKSKEIFDVPDDFDDAEGYNINMGEGVSGVGFRVVESEDLGGGQVRLTVDFENPDGSWSRRERLMVLNRGRWRLKPARVWR